MKGSKILSAVFGVLGILLMLAVRESRRMP